jgi:putative inorganic carbon (hco3(-)) transporter
MEMNDLMKYNHWNSDKTENEKWYFFSIIYLCFEYLRPQDFLPIGNVRPALILLAILSGYVFVNRGIPKAYCDQIKMILYFVGWTAAYVPFARNNYLAFSTTLNMLAFLPIIFSIINCVDSIDRLKKLVNMFIALYVIVSIYSLFHKGSGTGNFLFDENDLALYLNTWLPFSYFIMVTEKKVKAKIALAFSTICGVIGIVASFSRGGFVGFVCIMAVFWYFGKHKLITLSALLFMAATLYLIGGEKYVNEMATITDTTESTASERISTWNASLSMFLDQPWGVGGNNFQVWFPKYQPVDMKRNMWGRVAHSIWFTILPELGVIGCIIYARIIWYNFRDALRIKRFKGMQKEDFDYLETIAHAFIGSMVGYFASGTFLSALYYPHFWYLTALIVATIRIGNRIIDKERTDVIGISTRYAMH